MECTRMSTPCAPIHRSLAGLIAATGRGLYVSHDNGGSWEHVKEGLGQNYAVGLHLNPLSAGEMLVSTGDHPPGLDARVYHSIDGGQEWRQIMDPVLPSRYDRVPVVLFGEGRRLDSHG